MPRSYPSHPVVGVGAVVWRGEDVLLVRRANPPRPGSWTLPGGAQHVGETVAEAVHREIREETGVEIEIFDVVAVVDLIDRDDAGAVRFHYTVVDLLAEWRHGEATAGDDADAVAWVGTDDLDAFGVSPQAKRVIATAAGMRRRAIPANP